MTNEIAKQKISDMEKRMMGFVTAMSYNFCQLCVKADPSSLLTAEMSVQGDIKHVEDLAHVYIHTKENDGDDISINLYPKNTNYLPILSEGMMSAHPEFKQSLETMPGAPDESVKKAQQEQGIEYDERNYQFLLLTMPEVNKDRHDMLINSIDAIYEVCKANLEKIQAKCIEELVPIMVGSAQEDIKEAHDDIDKRHDSYKKMMKELKDQKKQEIEDAYQEYLEKKGIDKSSAGTNTEQAEASSQASATSEDSEESGKTSSLLNIGQSISL